MNLAFADGSAGSVVLVDEAGDGLPTLDPGRGQGDDIGVVQRRELAPALVRAVLA
jgi:hypothetical protein